ncbi:MAG: hypothetical protein JWO31_3293, partial [Phycisphaerales bacterium]|nr:hypothetical protein [Phycisphaerales bacterium]
DAAIKGQRIEVTAGNVDSFRLYLNDRMVDLSKPVTVAVNGRPKFEDVVPQSVAELLSDQLFLGRGWRYYTAVIDVETTARPPAPATRAASGPATRAAVVPAPATRPAGRSAVPR